VTTQKMCQNNILYHLLCAKKENNSYVPFNVPDKQVYKIQNNKSHVVFSLTVLVWHIIIIYYDKL